MKNYAQISVSLEPTKIERLNTLAKAQGLTRHALIRQLIENALAKGTRQK